MKSKKHFRDLEIQEQAEIILKHLKLTPKQKKMPRQKLIDEVIEYIILPALRKRNKIN